MHSPSFLSPPISCTDTVAACRPCRKPRASLGVRRAPADAVESEVRLDIAPRRALRSRFDTPRAPCCPIRGKRSRASVGGLAECSLSLLASADLADRALAPGLPKHRQTTPPRAPTRDERRDQLSPFSWLGQALLVPVAPTPTVISLSMVATRRRWQRRLRRLVVKLVTGLITAYCISKHGARDAVRSFFTGPFGNQTAPSIQQAPSLDTPHSSDGGRFVSLLTQATLALVTVLAAAKTAERHRLAKDGTRASKPAATTPHDTVRRL